jgi:hypothetical protein
LNCFDEVLSRSNGLVKEPLCHTHIKVNLGSIFLFLLVKGLSGAILSGPIRCGIALSLFAIGWTMASKYAIFNGHTSCISDAISFRQVQDTYLLYFTI